MLTQNILHILVKNTKWNESLSHYLHRVYGTLHKYG